jgi:Cdc6-like AAA superfamily ATPase
LIWKAVRIAESQNLNYITEECVKIADQEMLAITTKSTLKMMSKEQMLILYGLIQCLKIAEDTKVSMKKLYAVYEQTCRRLGIIPQSYQRIWDYLLDIKEERLIKIRSVDKDNNQTSLISISKENLGMIEEIVLNSLKFKRIQI